MTIGRERYGHFEPPHVRRGLLILGLIIIAAAVPLVVPLQAAAAVVSGVGGVALIYAFLPSSYPLLGVFGAAALTSVTFAIAYWLLND